MSPDSVLSVLMVYSPCAGQGLCAACQFSHSFSHYTPSNPQIRCVAADILWQLRANDAWPGMIARALQGALPRLGVGDGVPCLAAETPARGWSCACYNVPLSLGWRWYAATCESTYSSLRSFDNRNIWQHEHSFFQLKF